MITRHRQLLTSIRQLPWKRMARSHLCFPLLLLLLVIILTCAKITGSSVGIWHTMLYGPQSNDTNLIAGSPRAIRSDEWVLNTPLALSQSLRDEPRINDSVGNGQDMSLVDQPTKDWGTLFKPQNWAFFILPIEFAFAWKWWFMSWLLIVSCYYLCLFFMSKKQPWVWAALLAVGVFFSPFVQWWSLGTITPLALGCLTLLCLLHLLKSSPGTRVHRVLAVAFGYALTCFGIMLYPPFQIPILLVAAAFIAGQLLNMLRDEGLQATWKRLRLVLVAAGIAGVVVGSFLATRLDVVHTMQSTVYPGKRVVESGGFSASRLFSGPILGQLQDDKQAAHYSVNQSEAATFTVYPLLLLALGWLTVRRHKLKNWRQYDWRIIGLLGITVVFAAQLFIPHLPFIPKLFLLESIPHSRLMIGLALIHILTLILTIQYAGQSKQVPERWLIGTVWAGSFASFLVAGLHISHTYPQFIAASPKLWAVCLIASIVPPLLLWRKIAAGLTVLLALSILSTYHVNPMYRGLGALRDTPLSQKIQATGTDQDRWIVVDQFENFAILNGKRSISGTYIYPQLDIWKTASDDKKDAFAYNRFAHVFFTIDPTVSDKHPTGAYFEPPALDAFRVHIDPCGEFSRKQSLDYIVTTYPVKGAACMQQIDTISYPAQTFYMYRVTEP